MARWLVAGWLVARWLGAEVWVAGGWWLVAGGLVAGGWWLVAVVPKEENVCDNKEKTPHVAILKLFME